LKQYLLSTKLHYQDEQIGDLYKDDAAVLAGAGSDTQSLFTNVMLLVRSNTLDCEALENLLDTYDHQAFDIDTRDKYGNALILLACQQGGVSKNDESPGFFVNGSSTLIQSAGLLSGESLLCFSQSRFACPSSLITSS
jgi:hypothetical protein